MNAFFLKPVVSIVLVSLLCVGSASAFGNQALDQRLKPGIALFENGQYSEAYTAFMAVFGQDPENAQVNFYLGLAAMGLGDYENACLAFERTLMAEPDMGRARLELARAYLKLGLPDTARSYLAEVLDGAPPENVERNVRRLIEQIDAMERKHHVSGTLSLGINYDTNVGASPTESTISTPALSVPHVDVEEEEGDFFISSLLCAEHRLKLGPPGLAWRSSVLFYNSSFAEEHTQGLEYVKVTTGPTFQQVQRVVDLMLVAEFLAKESDDYLKAFGGQARFAQALWHRHFLVGEVLAVSREYDQEPDRRAYGLGLSVGPVFEWGRNRLVARMRMELEDARGGDDNFEEDELSYARYSGQVQYERLLPFDITARAAYSFSHTNYEADYAAFAQDRQDRVHAVLLGIGKKITEDLTVDLTNTYTKAGSSIELYEYNRNLTSFNVRLSF